MTHLLLFCSLLDTRQKADPQDKPPTVSIKVPVDSIQRALDEAELMRLLLEDFKNMDEKKSRVDLALRRRIDVLMRRLSKEY